SQDLNATVVDLLGAYDARASFPYADLATGHSLFRDEGRGHPLFVATSTAVWESDDSKYGEINGDLVDMTSEGTGNNWRCFDLAHDPAEHRSLPQQKCPGMAAAVMKEFPGVLTAPR
ncbi:MAG TPA: hypothetical protein VF407_01510, partial [Polyangiaceae bacterium]